MRDVDQMREKIELSLEGRQVAALAVGAVVLLSCVFALGLALGRKLGAESPRPAELEALDAQAASSKAELASLVARPEGAAKPDTAKPDTAKAEAAAKADAAAKPGDAAKSDAAAKPEAAAKPAEAKADTEAAAKPAAAPMLADATRRDVAEIPAPPREPLVVPPPPRTQIAPVILTPPPRELGAFTVQIGASPDRAEAQRLENRALAAGLKPYVVEADLGAKGTWYRVRVGSFPDRDSASLFRKDVERELRGTAIVMGTH